METYHLDPQKFTAIKRNFIISIPIVLSVLILLTFFGRLNPTQEMLGLAGRLVIFFIYVVGLVWYYWTIFNNYAGNKGNFQLQINGNKLICLKDDEVKIVIFREEIEKIVEFRGKGLVVYIKNQKIFPKCLFLFPKITKI